MVKKVLVKGTKNSDLSKEEFKSLYNFLSSSIHILKKKVSSKKELYLIQNKNRIRKKESIFLPDYEEIESELNMAFVQSALGFDKSKGFKFSTYVYGGLD